MARLLDGIEGGEDVRKLNSAELDLLAKELREEILRTVSPTGGHLASSLGAVELAIALHRVYRTPEDQIVWDVGHQAYAHKLLSGRRELFRNLRKLGGCAPFQSRAESPLYDPVGGGHAGTAISSALGLEAAARMQGRKTRVAAVVGDGALGCGVSLEGLNNIDENGSSLVIVLNDNRMSISPNVGALTRYLNRIISAKSYNRVRLRIKAALRKVPALYLAVRRFENSAKNVLLPGSWFEALGIRYLGPVNGHSIPELERTLTAARESRRPVLVHVVTRKGKGYSPAEADPEHYHGVSAFDPEKGLAPCRANGFSGVFGSTMLELAEQHRELVAVTAAMALGTGLEKFRGRYPGRFFDVGIAEEHALTFAAGLAAGGMTVAAAMYATFLQRALDEVYHDICLQNLPVILAVDRAGAVEDGPTHHGIYDLAFLRALPNMTVYTPADEQELRNALFTAVSARRPAAIRYPRGSSGNSFDPDAPFQRVDRSACLKRNGKDLAIWSCGAELSAALRTAEILAERHHLDAAVVHVAILKPFDGGLLVEQAAEMPVFTLEDHVLTGGLASAASECVSLAGTFGWPSDQVIPFGNVADLREKFGLAPEALAGRIAESVTKAGRSADASAEKGTGCGMNLAGGNVQCGKLPSV